MANVKKVVHRTTPFYHYRMRKGSIVNDSLPSHRYHYLLAELGRIDFLRSIGFVPESESFSSRVLHTAVTAAKLIARTSSDRATALEYISKIVKAIRPYLPGDKKELGRKTYSRLEKLLTHPSWFVTSVRFSRLFMFGSRRKEKQLLTEIAMLLIADSGSTKTRWACMTQGSKPEIFVTPGINPVTMKYAQIAEILDEQLAPQIGNRTVDEIYFMVRDAARRNMR